MKSVFKKAVCAATALSLTAAMAVMPSMADAEDSGAYYFADNFEQYTEGQAIPAAANGGVWEQVQSGGFYAVKDPTDDANMVGFWGNAEGGATGSYITNRTPQIDLHTPTVISGRIYLTDSQIVFNIPGYNQAVYFYNMREGNNNSCRIMQNYAWIGKWVPEKWIDYDICIDVDVVDPSQSTLSLFFESEEGLQDNDGNPVDSLYMTTTIDMTDQNLVNMIRMDSNQGGNTGGVYMDDVVVEQVSEFEMSIPENKNVSGSVTVNFSRPIAKSLIAADNFRLETSSGTPVEITSAVPAGEEKWAVDENTGWVTSAVITPADGFAGDTVYRLSASTAVRDYINNTCGNVVYLSTNDSEPPASEEADILVNGISLDPTILNLPENLSELGLDCVVAATVFPENAANQTLSWSSSNDSVVTVEQNGNVIPVAPGHATVTVEATDGSGVRSTIDVTVTEERADDQKLNLKPEEVPDRDIAEALEYPTEEEVAKVALWKDNATGAVTITTDDGNIYYQSFQDWINYKNEYGYNITFFPWTNEAATDGFKNMFQPLVDAGMDIQSHTRTHHSDHQQKFLTTGQLIEEYYQPVRTIGARILAYPYGLQPYSDNVNYEDESVRGVPFDEKAYASLYYIAARGGTGSGINMPTRNVNSNQFATDYMALGGFSIHTWNATTYGTSDIAIEGVIKSLYDENYTYNGTANIGGWAILLVHSLAEAPSSNNPSYPGQQATNIMIFDDTFGYLQEAGDELWTDDFLDIAKYGQERDSAVLNVVTADDNEIVYDLTDSMSDEEFDYPLTIMVNIPGDWTGVTAVQNDEELTTSMKDGYLFVETVPDKGSVRISHDGSEVVLPENPVSADVVKAWPEGKLKAFTASFDDGYLNYENEQWLVDVFNANGIKGTFNMPSGLFNDYNTDAAAFKELYTGFEVAAHTAYHTKYSEYTPDFFEDAVQADIEALPAITEGAIEGIAYPNGESANEEEKEILKDNGILYGRSTYSSRNFEIPDDLYNWNPTCFQYNIGEFQSDAQTFVSMSPSEMKLMEVWGHGYQLNDDNKAATRAVYELAGNRDDIYYASNIEIAKYLMAIDELVISTDESNITTVYNPSDMTVWVNASGKGVEIPAGETKCITARTTSEDGVLVDPCTADPNGSEVVFTSRENGIGQASIVDTNTGENDTAYARYDMADGRVHSLIYSAGTSYFTGVNLRTYSRSTSDTARFSPIKVYASPDGAEYTEVVMDYNQVGDRNDWWLYRVDYKDQSGLPEGTKFIKVSFPEDFIVNASDSVNEVLIGNVELAMDAQRSVLVFDELPMEPELTASSFNGDSVELVFNRVMDAASVADAISFDGGFTVSPQTNAKAYTVSFNEPLASGTDYTLTVSGAQDAAGTAAADATVDFTTEDLLNGVLEDEANDYRYVYEFGGNLSILSGVGGDSNIGFARTAADTADSTSYVIYRAPYGEFTSLSLQLYRNEGACANPFTVYAASSDKVFTKVADDTQGEWSEMIDRGYYPIQLTLDSLPEGTEYIKIEFPVYSEQDGATAYHMAQIADVKATYSTSLPEAVMSNVNILSADSEGTVVGRVDSVGEAAGNNADISVRLSTLDPGLGGTDADMLFAVYSDGVLKSCEIRNVTLPEGGEPAFERISVPVGTDEAESITVKCMLWDSAETMDSLSPAVSR